MKFSTFNIEKNVDGGKLIYNTMSSGILFVEDKKIKEFEKLKNSNCIDIVNSDLKNELIKGKMIIKEDLNELELIKYISNSARYNKDSL